MTMKVGCTKKQRNLCKDLFRERGLKFNFSKNMGFNSARITAYMLDKPESIVETALKEFRNYSERTKTFITTKEPTMKFSDGRYLTAEKAKSIRNIGGTIESISIGSKRNHKYINLVISPSDEAMFDEHLGDDIDSGLVRVSLSVAAVVVVVSSLNQVYTAISEDDETTTTSRKKYCVVSKL